MLELAGTLVPKRNYEWEAYREEEVCLLFRLLTFDFLDSLVSHVRRRSAPHLLTLSIV